MSAPIASLPPLVALLRRQADAHPERLAFSFLADGESPGPQLSYAALDAAARAIAVRLLKHARPGDRAMLLYAPGLDYVAAFWGCLYAGLVAVPVYPPRDAKTRDRLLAIARDAQAKLALTTTDLLAQTRAARWLTPSLRAMKWVATDRPDTDPAGWRETAAPADTLAFLQYTSGSTGVPKGVMVSHANLVHNASLLQAAWDASAMEGPVPTFLSWLPLYHDMGLIGKVIVPVTMGGTSVLMSPLHFLQNPLRWPRAVSRFQATVSAGPNFAYDLCARKIGPDEAATLDLSGWRVAVNGAEPIRPETLRRFATAFAPAGFQWRSFYPCYGLAESTLFVSGGLGHAPPQAAEVDAEALAGHRVAGPVGSLPTLAALTEAPADLAPTAKVLVGCGRAWKDQRPLIVDPETRVPVAPGTVGEIWVSGPSVAAGYWRRPEETLRAFHATLADGDGPWLRTGDLGFLLDGELFVTGRLKDLIIIRGRNLYPQDVERTMDACHPSLRAGGAAAFAVEVGSEERLVVVHEVDKRQAAPEPADVRGAAQRAIAESHEVTLHDLVLVTHGTLPKTSSGKVQRHRAKEAYLAGGLSAWKRP